VTAELRWLVNPGIQCRNSFADALTRQACRFASETQMWLRRALFSFRVGARSKHMGASPPNITAITALGEGQFHYLTKDAFTKLTSDK
jgi:hypothetical protein